jgi:hypothetical protein
MSGAVTSRVGARVEVLAQRWTDRCPMQQCLRCSARRREAAQRFAPWLDSRRRPSRARPRRARRVANGHGRFGEAAQRSAREPIGAQTLQLAGGVAVRDRARVRGRLAAPNWRRYCVTGSAGRRHAEVSSTIHGGADAGSGDGRAVRRNRLWFGITKIRLRLRTLPVG